MVIIWVVQIPGTSGSGAGGKSSTWSRVFLPESFAIPRYWSRNDCYTWTPNLFKFRENWPIKQWTECEIKYLESWVREVNVEPEWPQVPSVELRSPKAHLSLVEYPQQWSARAGRCPSAGGVGSCSPNFQPPRGSIFLVGWAKPYICQILGDG